MRPVSISTASSARLLRTAGGILAVGSAHMRLNQACRRCLELFETEVSFEIEEEFVPCVNVQTGTGLAIADKDSPELVIDEHHMLDLTEVLRQYVILAASDPGLCRPDCKGLCPSCGSVLNLGPCDCQKVSVDPRFTVLAELLKPSSQAE